MLRKTHMLDDIYFFVMCLGCNKATNAFPLEEEAIEAWNKRAERIGFWRLSTPFVDTVECSLCGYQWPEPAMASKYCPDCGALMFKEVEKFPEEEAGKNG